MTKSNALKVSVCGVKTFCLSLLTGTLFLFSFPLKASESEKNVKYVVDSKGTVAEVTDSKATVMTEITETQVEEKKEPGRESIFGGNRPLDNSHFTWGADLGASLDLTAHDMSTFDIDVILGYKNKYFKTAGIGVGIHRTVQGGDNFIPIYALIRTSFTSRPSLLFFNARFGYSFNTIDDSPTFGDFNSALGCGINLSKSKRANTYLILSAAYRYFNERHKNMVSRIDTHSIWMAQLQFGVNF